MKVGFVLLSGGIDSTTCLHIANLACDEVFAVGINYGQRHKRELEFAKRSCHNLGVTYTILDVGELLSGKEVLLSAQSVGEREMVHKDYSELKGVSPSYVPFRNGLLLSAVTAHAQKYVNKHIARREDELWDTGIFSDPEDARKSATEEAKDMASIYYGAHAEDSANWAYPDCTPEFNGSMANAIYTGSYNTIRLETPLQWMEKWQIIRRGIELGVDYSLTWSCYDTGEYHCGECPTCLARKAAFEKAGVPDPTVYVK